jgi:hypothetical protein
MKLQIQSRGSKKLLAELEVTEKTSVQDLKKQYAKKCMPLCHNLFILAAIFFHGVYTNFTTPSIRDSLENFNNENEVAIPRITFSLCSPKV